jgi:hypothetical protein
MLPLTPIEGLILPSPLSYHSFTRLPCEKKEENKRVLSKKENRRIMNKKPWIQNKIEYGVRMS